MHESVEKATLITGAGRGIGKRLAIGLAKSGAKIGLISRTITELDAARLEIEHAGGHAAHAQADVRDYTQIVHAVQVLKRKLHVIDVLVAAAGVQGPVGPVAYTDPKLWKEVIDTNILGVMNSIHAVLPYMIEQRSGKIIVLAGGGAANPRPNFAPYAVTKTAIARLVETVAEEVRDHNIQVNCFAPGGSYTSMTDEILEAGDRAGLSEIQEAEQIRLTGGISAERQVQFVQFLASDKSNHISGKLIRVGDDLKKLEHTNMTPDLYTLRRSR